MLDVVDQYLHHVAGNVLPLWSEGLFNSGATTFQFRRDNLGFGWNMTKGVRSEAKKSNGNARKKEIK
jgi:hypothetical protein